MRTPSGEMKASTLKKGSWSPEEDQKLVSYINRYGIWNWSYMPKFAGLLRSGKSCRLRWMNYLKPNIKRGKFSKEEEEIILHAHSLLGNRWSTIATRVPGRTDNEIKNHWHSCLKKRGSKHNLVRETTNSNDSNMSSAYEDTNNINVAQSSMTFEDDSSSSSTSNSSSIEKQVDIKDSYYDIGSPGTIEDLQWFWKQLCPIENLEFGNNHQDLFSEMEFLGSFHDNSISLYNLEFDI